MTKQVREQGPAAGPEPGGVADAAAAPAVSGAVSEVVAEAVAKVTADAAAAVEQVDPEQPPARQVPLLVESIGGWRGLFDSGIPVIVFVAANAIAGLTAAIWAAVACGIVLFGVRLARKESVQQAVSGFLGVALAAYIASRTGEAKGFFLLGIWASFGYAALFLVSVLVRWPLVGVVWEYVDGGGGRWRKDAPLLRVYTWTSLVWIAVFLARGLVQRFLYNEDRTGMLAVARLAMGYPLTVGALALTIVAVRRVRRQADPDGEDPEPADAPGPTAGRDTGSAAGSGGPAEQPA
ncbi:MAG: hypothetical protein V7637_2127 [Mycobacteriales bacterium]